MYRTMRNGTVALDFEACERKARGMTRDALMWSARDAREAAEANPGARKAGAWTDEMHTYLSEVARRDRAEGA